MSEGFHRPFVPAEPVSGVAVIPVRQGASGGLALWARRLGGAEAVVPPFDDGELAAPRRALQGLTNEQAVQGLAATLGGAAAAAGVLAAGRWFTPAFAQARWALEVWLLPLSRDAEPSADGEWRDARSWVEAHARGTAWPGPLLLRVATALFAASDAGQAAASLRAPAETADAIDLGAGVLVMPLHTPTLPPATHTNCVVFGPTGRAVVVDPGSPYVEDHERLLRLLERCMERGARFERIVLTHHHQDHVSGAELLRRHFDVAVVAHPLTAERLSGRALVDEFALDGDLLPIGADGEGRALRVVHTPGHARGHIVLLDTATSVLVGGDMVAGQGTIVIDPPEGEMAAYLASLEAMRGLDARLLVPAHGPPIANPDARLAEYVRHRLWREGRIVTALRERGAMTVAQMVPLVYDDVSKAVHPLAARQALAHLQKLEAEGTVRVTADERWWAAPG